MISHSIAYEYTSGSKVCCTAFILTSRDRTSSDVYLGLSLSVQYKHFPLPLVLGPALSLSIPADHLEGVVFGRDLVDEVIADERDLLHDIFLDLGYTVEEEQGKDTGNNTKASHRSKAAA